MPPVKSSDEDGSERSRSVRENGARPRELRRPKQETLDLLNETLRSVQEEAFSQVQETRRKLQLDLNDNIRPEDLSLPPSSGTATPAPSSDSGAETQSEGDFANETYFPFDLSLKEYLKDPEPGSKIPFPYIQTQFLKRIKVKRPIGLTILVNGNVVVGDRQEDSVTMYNKDCEKIKEIKAERKFKRPSDMVTLPDGRFVVRDDNGLQMFDEEGDFLRTVVPKGVLGMCFGLATDGRGHIYTINSNRRGATECLTKKGETDILIISAESGQIVEQIQLLDVITDNRKSQCKFLHCDGVNLFISDLGLNVVYVMTLGSGTVRSFGQTGQNFGQFKDVAGIAADSVGNILVVDACNNRIQVFNDKRQFTGMVRMPKNWNLKRPSGIALDLEDETIYVLNLWSNCLLKFKLIKA